MLKNTSRRPSVKTLVLASLGLLIPFFIVAIVFLAVKSDAKNQAEYAKQEAEMLARIAEREAAEKAAVDVKP